MQGEALGTDSTLRGGGPKPPAKNQKRLGSEEGEAPAAREVGVVIKIQRSSVQEKNQLIRNGKALLKVEGEWWG